jgi:hypothetical protein
MDQVRWACGGPGAMGQWRLTSLCTLTTGFTELNAMCDYELIRVE